MKQEESESQIFRGDNLTTEPVIVLATSDGELPESIQDLAPNQVQDRYLEQVAEWIVIQNPTMPMSDEQRLERAREWVKTGDPGVWVYYPWLDTAVRTLSEEMFRTVRSSRNRYKIKDAEQENLREKTVGIIGLSVGQSAAVTLAMEGVGGTLRLADFDHLDLSNLNRLRAGIHQLGLPKTVLAAREIAEIDPFIKVELFHEGLTPENALTFLSGLDLVVEECDSLPIKILVRKYAQKLKLPVIMDTSDRGMVDVERFDLEPERPIFHGKLENWEGRDPSTFTPEDRVQLLFSLVDYNSASDRAKGSFAEIGKSITTWPQLASAVTLGGAMMTDTARRILLSNQVESGRYYIDLEHLIGKE